MSKTQLLKQAKAKLARNNFHFFVLEAFTNVLKPSAILIDNWHIKEICDLLQGETERIARGLPKVTDIIINVPPRSLKSIIVSQCWNAWAWIDHPEQSFINTSHGKTLAGKMSAKTQDIIESSWYQDNWSDSFEQSKKQWAKTAFMNSKRGERIATSVGSTITGEGGDVIIVDDPQDPESAESELDRIAVNNYWDSTLSTRLDNPKIGVMVIIMQRLNEMDLTGHVLADDPTGYTHYQFPARLSENEVLPKKFEHYYEQQEGMFFIRRFDQEWLDRMKKRLGSKSYDNQFAQKGSPEEGDIYKKEWFPYRYYIHELPKIVVWNFLVDTSYGEDARKKALNAKKRKGNDPDFNAILACCEYKNNIYIRSWHLDKSEFPEFCKNLRSFVLANGYSFESRIYVEPKASGKSVVQELRATTSLNIIEDIPPDVSKIVRARAQTAKAESGRVFLPFETESMNKDFIYHICGFPNLANDDLMDVFIMALRRLLSYEDVPEPEVRPANLI